MVRRFRCVVCNNLVESKPPHVAICKNCKAFYIFKYAKDRKRSKVKGHYIFAGFLEDRS